MTGGLATAPALAAADDPKPRARNTRTVIQERWLCDVCGVRSFVDYDEACRHEAACDGAGAGGGGIGGGGGSSSSSSTEAAGPAAAATVSAVAVAEAAGQRPPVETGLGESKEKSDNSSSSSAETPPVNRSRRSGRPRWAAAAASIGADASPSSSSESESSASASALEAKVVNRKKKKKNAPPEKRTKKEVVTAPIFQRAGRKTKKRPPAVRDADYDNDDARRRREEEKVPASAKRTPAAFTATATGTAAAAAGGPSPKTLASIFSPRRPPPAAAKKSIISSSKATPTTATVQALLAEHRTAEFAAERRVKAERERARRKRREEAAVVAAAAADDASEDAGSDNEEEDDGGSDDGRGGRGSDRNGGNGKGGRVKVASIFARPKPKQQQRRRRRPSSKRKRGGKGADAAAAAENAPAPAPTNKPSASERTTAATGIATISSAAGSARNSYPSAPRFPVPSHVIGGGTMTADQEEEDNGGGIGPNGWRRIDVDDDVGRRLISPELIDGARRSLVGAAKYQTPEGSIGAMSAAADDKNGGTEEERLGEYVPSTTQQASSSKSPSLLLTADPKLNIRGDGAGCGGEDGGPLARAFASALLPPSSTASGGDRNGQRQQQQKGRNDDDADNANADLWSAKHAIRSLPGNVCGADNKASAEALAKFIGEWKDHRSHYVKRMEEKKMAALSSTSARGRKARKQQQSKKKCYGYESDDDFMEWDSDEEEDPGLCNAFLLTGPTGSGKTSLVHAAAEEAECVLLEINTTERRGGAALKRAIEECTQSHSSLALLRRGDGGGGAEEVLVDTDDEDDDVDGGRGRLAIVLIDEVDNIFENDGDAGFWSALANLTKKAKCPIILTATAAPPLLYASTIRFLSACMTRPTAMECASKIWQVAQMEGMARVPNVADDGEASMERLCRIAEHCNCDLRRILNEMQLFSHSCTTTSQGSKDERSLHDSRCTKYSQVGGSCKSGLEFPVISDVSPMTLSSAQHSLVTIKGRNFLPGAHVTGAEKWITEVLIGNHPCPAVRVLNDSTILAVCPPCAIPMGVNASGIFQDSLEECLTCQYASIVVRTMTPNGLVFRSDSLSPVSSQHDSRGKRWNVEYCFPPMEGLFLEKILSIKEQKRKGDARPLEREESLDAVSSSDDDFVIRSVPDKGRELESDGKIANVVSMTSETIDVSDASNDENACSQVLSANMATDDDDFDIQALLEDGVKAYSLEQTTSNDDEAHMVTDSQSQSQATAEKAMQQEVEALAKGMEYSSDAAFLEDSLTSMAIPYLSGAVKGFGSDMIDQTFGHPGNVPKKLRNGNAKPPSVERLYASGWNDSAFFFGASESYVTMPTLRRDRSELAKAHIFSRALVPAHSDCGVGSPSDSDEEASSNISTVRTNTGVQKAVQSEDDLFLHPIPPSPILSLPSMLRDAFASPDNENLPLLARRMSEQESSTLMLALPLLPDSGKTYSFCLGLDTIGTKPSLSIALDARFSLDYVPFLRAMAAAEHSAEIKFSELRERNPNALGSDHASTRRSTRRKMKAGRRHYFEDLLPATRRQGQSSLLAKETGAKLSTLLLSYFMYDGRKNE